METPNSEQQKYQEFLPKNLRGTYQEGREMIKLLGSSLSEVFPTQEEKETTELTLTSEQFSFAPNSLKEIFRDLFITKNDHPTITVTRPTEKGAFAFSIDPEVYVMDHNAGLTITVGRSGVTQEVRFVNHTGNVIHSSSLGYGRDVGTPLITKYFTPESVETPESQGTYSEATSELYFLHNQRVKLLKEFIPWVVEQYKNRGTIQIDPEVLKVRSISFNIPEVLAEAHKIINPQQALPPEDDQHILKNAEDILSRHYEKIKPPPLPRVLRDAEEAANKTNGSS